MKAEDSIDLYIFVTSPIPDLYINIIGYCIEHYRITNITFLGIVEDKGQKDKIKDSLDSIKDRVNKQLLLLQQGRYLYRDQDTGQWQEKSIQIGKPDKSRYTRIAGQSIETKVIVYDDLDDEIEKFLNPGSCIFDVSGVLKGLLIDVYTLLLMQKCENVYVFELRLPSRTYDERELIHNLVSDRRDYEYVKITESRFTKGTIIKTRAMEEAERSKISGAFAFIEILADRFARNILMAYGVFVFFIFIWSSQFVIKGNWDKLEPWTFLLLAMLPYLVNIMMLALFKKEPSLKPRLLYNWLKDYHSKALKDKLQKELGQLS